MTTTSVLGRLLWYELMTSDLPAAEAFYTAVVGWSTSPFDGTPMPYTMWMRGEVPVGGAMNLPDDVVAHGVPPHWMLYVGVDDLEATVAQATRLGATVVSPVIEVPGVGRLQTLKDPQGAAFSVYQPSAPPPHPEAKPEPGDTSWLELYTTDSEAAMGFYRELFGWQPTEAMDMGPMGIYRMFGRHLGSLGGMLTKVDDMVPLPTAWLLYFLVPDIRSAAERVTAHGGTVLNGPMQVPGGDWILQARDPQGAAFCLHAKA